MNKRQFGLFGLAVLLLIVSVSEVQARQPSIRGRLWALHKQGAIAYLNPDHLWYNYSDFSVYWVSSAYSTMLIDLDGVLWQSADAFGSYTMRTCAVSYSRGWSYVWGTFAEYGIGFISPRLQFYWHNWYFIIAQYGIQNDTDGDYVWHKRADASLGSPNPVFMESEWFCYEIVHPTAPTDYLVRLRNSNGVGPLPVTNRFWYSFDAGATWSYFTP